MGAVPGSIPTPDLAIHHRRSYRLLGAMVGRRQSGFEEEAEERSDVVLVLEMPEEPAVPVVGRRPVQQGLHLLDQLPGRRDPDSTPLPLPILDHVRRSRGIRQTIDLETR